MGKVSLDVLVQEALEKAYREHRLKNRFKLNLTSTLLIKNQEPTTRTARGKLVNQGIDTFYLILMEGDRAIPIASLEEDREHKLTFKGGNLPLVRSREEEIGTALRTYLK